MKKLRGFTLIEMMVVLVIISILASIAYPSYVASVRKSHRADAKASLNDIAIRMQRCFTSNTTFLSSTNQVCAISDQLKTTTGVQSSYYVVTAGSTITATAYTLTAVPLSGTDQVNDTVCAQFLLEQTGKKTAVDSSGADSTSKCW